MPDWKALVQARILRIDLPVSEWDEIVEELGGHLEERCAKLRSQGISAEEAVNRSLEEVSDWDCLAREMQAAISGDPMNLRTRAFWLPGALTLTLSMGFLLVLQYSGVEPRTVLWEYDGQLLLFYFPWLVSLPVFGALGAFLSLRAGGSIRIVLLCSIFPAAYQMFCFFVILPLAFVFNRNVAVHFHLGSLLPQLLAWLFLPIAALFAGGVGMLAANRRRLAVR